MKILFNSNAPWTQSGYGVQSKLLVNYLKKEHEIIFLTNYGLSGAAFRHEGVTYLPYNVNSPTFCNDVIDYFTKKYRPNIILSLLDWFVLDLDEWKKNNVPWFHWTPIDTDFIMAPEIDTSIEKDDILYKDRSFKNFCLNGPKIVTMSNFGSEQVEKFNAQPIDMIYHAVDSAKFKILDKEKVKKSFGYSPDTFVIGMNMANKFSAENRKAFNFQFLAIRKFMQNHPDLDIKLYINSDLSGNNAAGFNLLDLVQFVELDLYKVQVTNPMRYNSDPFSTEEIVNMYNAFDVLMNASSAEGFGVPIIEAQACGVPVITHDSTSMPELTFYGYSAKSQEDVRIPTGVMGLTYRFVPSVDDLVNGLEYVLENRSEQKAKETSDFVREKFNISNIGSKWNNLIKDNT